MQYPYMCLKCGNDFDVIKPVSEIDFQEKCSKCGNIAERYISKVHFYGADDWNKQEFNPGLGCYVRNNIHKKKILKEMAARGKHVEEIGNEPVDKMHQQFEATRDEKRRKRWEAADSIKTSEEMY